MLKNESEVVFSNWHFRQHNTIPLQHRSHYPFFCGKDRPCLTLTRSSFCREQFDQPQNPSLDPKDIPFPRPDRATNIHNSLYFPIYRFL